MANICSLASSRSFYCWSLFGEAWPTPRAHPVNSGTYVVKPGDTLWSIAHHYYGGDTRRGVWDLEQRNDLGRSVLLIPGQRLIVPL